LKGGVWELATFSFPGRLALGARCHPSSVIGCQFPDAAPAGSGRLACLSGSAAEPADGVTTTGLSGEASWPGCRAPADAPGSGLRTTTPLGAVMFSLASPRSASRSSCGTVIVGLGIRVLPLTPHVAFSFPGGRLPRDNLPLVSGLIGLDRGHHPFRGAFLRPASARDGRIPFSSFPVATPADCAALSSRPAPQDPFPPHWLTVATIGL